ncbi:MAG: hypothetical protein AAF299_05965 [Pseudomonadota bacterium]
MKISRVLSTGNVVRVAEGPDDVKPAKSGIHVARGASCPETTSSNHWARRKTDGVVIDNPDVLLLSHVGLRLCV